MITREQVFDVLKTVNDPELMIDVWTLELIYDLKVENDNIDIKMTFTSPLCPYGPMILEEIKQKINDLKPKILPTLTIFSAFVPYSLVVPANLANSFSVFLIPK